MRVLMLLPLALVAIVAHAQTSPTARPPACEGATYRQFDFWLGEWSVADSSGNPAGRSQITREANGCAIREVWTGAGGMTGTSINYFDRADSAWHQLWVGGGGMILHLKGTIEEGAMTLVGTRTTPKGTVRDRIRWTPLADGRVSQEWSVTSDDGATWTQVFLGFYSRQ
jgi:hypothetical protein